MKPLLRWCAIGALGLVVLEVAPRVVTIPRLAARDLNPIELDSPQHLGFEPHANLVLVPKAGYRRVTEGGKSIEHNSAGFRGPEMARDKPPGVFRIACLGGSSTYGTGPTSDATTWPRVLERELRAASPQRAFEVLNAGAPTWTSLESLVNLAARVVPYTPDLVLVYHGMNDASAALWPSPVPDNHHFRQVWPVWRKSRTEALLEHSVSYLIWRRYFTDHFAERLDANYRAIRNYAPDYVDPYGSGPLPDEGFESFRRNLTSIVAVARAHGANVAFVTQALWSDDPDSDSFWTGRNRLRAMFRMEGVQREVALALEVEVLDAAPVLLQAARAEVGSGRSQTHFAGDVHLTDLGATVLGRWIAQQLDSKAILTR